MNLSFINVYMDELSLFFILVVNIVALFASFYTLQSRKGTSLREDYSQSKFHLWFNLFHFTMLTVLVMDNLVVLWIAVQLTTVSSALLVRHSGTRSAAEAAWKFLIITTTGVIFAFLGTILLAYAYYATLEDLSKQKPELLDLRWSLLAHPGTINQSNYNILVVSFLLVLIGYGTKAGLAPMHTWLPDGHGEAPAPVSAMLSGVMLKTAFYAILRFFTIAWLNLGEEFILNLLLCSGILSLLIATPLILKQQYKFKRVLAYHSLEHMGIIAFGVGIGSKVAIFGALLHALNHALTKALMFLVYGHIQDSYHEISHTSAGRSAGRSRYEAGNDKHIRGVWKKMPVVGTVLTGGGLALVGAPPFSIFMSEFIILGAAIQKFQDGPPNGPPDLQHWLLVGAIPLYLLTLTLIFGGLVGHISRLLFDSTSAGRSVGREGSEFETSRYDVTSADRLVKVGYARLRFFSFGSLLLLMLISGLTIIRWPLDLPELLNESARIVLEGSQPR